MAVSKQMPIVTYTANGTTNKFPVTFDLHDPRYLIITVNKEIPAVGAYTVEGKSIVFLAAPNSGDEVTIARDTVADRETNFKSYDNSMRPDVFNYDFDKIWHVLQEQNLVDAVSLSRLKSEVEWRRTHDFNYDELARARDAQVFRGLKQYVDTYIAATSPNIFGGVTAGVVFALDHKSVQTHIENIANEFEKVRKEIEVKADKSEIVKLDIKKADIIYVDEKVAGISNGLAASYKTYDEAVAATTAVKPNSSIKVMNDLDSIKNGEYTWDGKALKKSDYDPKVQAVKESKLYVKKTELNRIQPYSIIGANMFNEILNQVDILANHQSYTDNCFVDDKGNMVSVDSTKTTDFIRTKFGSVYIMSYPAFYVAAIYNADLQFIKIIKTAIEGTPYKFSVDDKNAEFIRFMIVKDKNTTVTEILNKYSLSWLKATPDNIADAVQSLLTGGENVNLIDNVEMISGGYLDDKNIVQKYESYAYTKDFIKIEGGVTYEISLASTFIGVFFDANKQLIGSIPGSTPTGTLNYEFISPVNAKYIKLNISHTDKIKSLKKKNYVINTKQSSAWQNKIIAWYGTSISAGYPHSNTDADRDKYSHANLAVHDLGARIINKCVPAGGVGLKVGLSFARTTDAINYQSSLLSLIGTKDEPDLVVFDFGVNDYDQSPRDIDAFDPSDPLNEKMSIASKDASTFIGAHNMIIDAMLSKNPSLKFCFITHFSNDNANPNIAQKQDFFKQLNIVIQALADYWSAPILNLHKKTGYRNRNNFNSIDPAMPDHVHPASGNGKSVESLRNIVRSFLISIA